MANLRKFATMMAASTTTRSYFALLCRPEGTPTMFASVQHPRNAISIWRLFSDNQTSYSIDPEHAKAYSLTGVTAAKNKSGVRVQTNTGHVLATDVPRKMGGKDTAPQPVETLLTALIGCTQATALFVGRQIKPNRLVIQRMEFDLTGIRDERGALTLPIDVEPEVPSRLQHVTGKVRVFAEKSEPISPATLELLKEQTEIRCPVANMMIASGCELQVEWLDGNQDPIVSG